MLFFLLKKARNDRVIERVKHFWAFEKDKLDVLFSFSNFIPSDPANSPTMQTVQCTVSWFTKTPKKTPKPKKSKISENQTNF